MADVAIARALHVLAVILWIGGVGMVTTVFLPALQRQGPGAADRLQAFHALEQRFARQARITTVLAGLTGFYMVWRMGAWDRFQSAEFWWMHAMVLTWLVFTAMLFVIEPLVSGRAFRRAAQAPEAATRKALWLHRVLLALSLLTAAGAVAGSHGVNLFD